VCPNRCRQEWRDEQIADEEAAERQKKEEEERNEEIGVEAEQNLEVAKKLEEAEKILEDAKKLEDAHRSRQEEEERRRDDEIVAAKDESQPGSSDTDGDTFTITLLVIVIVIGVAVIFVTGLTCFLCFRLATASAQNTSPQDGGEYGRRTHYDPRDIEMRADRARSSRRQFPMSEKKSRRGRESMGFQEDWRSMERDCYDMLGEASSTQIRDAMDSSPEYAGMDSASCSMGGFGSD